MSSQAMTSGVARDSLQPKLHPASTNLSGHGQAFYRGYKAFMWSPPVYFVPEGSQRPIG